MHNPVENRYLVNMDTSKNKIKIIFKTKISANMDIFIAKKKTFDIKNYYNHHK